MNFNIEEEILIYVTSCIYSFVWENKKINNKFKIVVFWWEEYCKLIYMYWDKFIILINKDKLMY